jgi:hypothetical protein
MSQSLERRLHNVETAHAACRKTHYLWWGEDETQADVAAKKRAMIASGKASPNDRFITFTWRRPEGEADR